RCLVDPLDVTGRVMEGGDGKAEPVGEGPQIPAGIAGRVAFPDARIHAHGEDLEVVAPKGVVQSLHGGHLLAARTAPGRPDVHEHDPVLEVRERNLLPVQSGGREVRRLPAGQDRTVALPSQPRDHDDRHGAEGRPQIWGSGKASLHGPAFSAGVSVGLPRACDDAPDATDHADHCSLPTPPRPTEMRTSLPRVSSVSAAGSCSTTTPWSRPNRNTSRTSDTTSPRESSTATASSRGMPRTIGIGIIAGPVLTTSRTSAGSETS